MAQDKRTKSGQRVETGEPSQLKHSPFAHLTVKPASTQPPETSADAQPEVAAAQPTPAPAPRAKSRGRLLLRRETKKRAGKAVIVVYGFPTEAELSTPEAKQLLSELKQTLGCGGTLEGAGADREIVVQGDQAARVAELLRAKGFKVAGVTS